MKEPVAPPGRCHCGDGFLLDRCREFAVSEDCRSLFLLIMIFMLTGFNIEVVRLVTLAVTGVSDTAKAWVGSSMQVGALLGATTLGGQVGDWYGRRTAILYSAAGFMLIAGVAIVLEMTLGLTYWVLIGVHVVRGLCFGVAVANAQPWATERLTDERRGWVSSWGHMGWAFGHALGLFCGKLGVTQTRDLEVLPLVPAIFVFSVVYASSESAMWTNQSRDILPYTELLRGHGHKIALLTLMWFIIPCASYITYYWGPEMLMEISGEEEMDYAFFMMLHIMGIPSSMLAGSVVDFGRRLCLVTDLLLLTVGLIAVQLAQTTTIWKLSFFFAEVCITVGWTIGPIMISESFPTIFRTRAYGTLQMACRIGSIAGPVITGSLRDNDKIHFLFQGLAAIAFAAACSVFFMPEPQFAKAEAKAEESSLTSA